MGKIDVHGEQVSYPIYFRDDFSFLLEALKKAGFSNRKLCIITDANVDYFHGDNLIKLLQKEYTSICKYICTPGEKHKNLETIYDMYTFFLNHHLDRQSLIIALGGGVVGDMAGFVAATYMRGIPFIQIPTTLLSQVDSSVGGKVGVDFLKHKNIIGAFYQPRFVYINISTLQTLPLRERSAGMAEIIKHGLILDQSYYEYVKTHKQQIMDLHFPTLKQIICRSCELKASIVEQDEKEKGLREILNFGHTFGHAIETLLDFKLLHGECVAIGIVGAAYLSYQLEKISLENVKDIENILLDYHLPIRANGIEQNELYQQLFLDKKVKQDQLHFVLLSKIGDTVCVSNLSESIIHSAIGYICKTVR